MDLSFEIIQALKTIARSKEVDESLIIETLEAGLISAARKKFGAESKIEVDINQEENKLNVYCCKDVVGEVEDPQTQMTLEDAREIDPSAEVGGELKFEIPLAQFGRNAIQAAKQVVIQRVREAERDRVFREYEDRIGEVVSGNVQQIERGNLIVNLGRTEALLPQREQIPREQFRQVSSIRALIIDVSKSSKGPQVILSRSHPDFLRRLFAMEVPEIKDGTVEIKAVAREPGGRSKIAVHSHDDKIDAVGACVGMKGSRVQTVVRELNGERIDIVLWGDDPIAFVTRALSPAKVVHAELDEPDGKVTVVVADDQLSLAIGKGGQNARLAAKLTSLKIDLINESQYSERLEFQKLARFPVSEISDISERLRGLLSAAGYETADELSRASICDLVEIEGIGEKTAAKVVEAARKKIGELREKFEADRAAAREELEALGEEDEEEIEDEGEEETGEELQEPEEGEEAEDAEEPGEEPDRDLGGEPEEAEDVEAPEAMRGQNGIGEGSYAGELAQSGPGTAAEDDVEIEAGREVGESDGHEEAEPSEPEEPKKEVDG
jgi:N utilization substance protein A